MENNNYIVIEYQPDMIPNEVLDYYIRLSHALGTKVIDTYYINISDGLKLYTIVKENDPKIIALLQDFTLLSDEAIEVYTLRDFTDTLSITEEEAFLGGFTIIS